MILKKPRSIAIFIALLSAVNMMSQSQYFVSTSGNDNNTGTSVNQAWLTVQHAIDEVGINSTINILSGTYNEQLSFNKSGMLNKAIILQNYNDDKVIIDGTGLTSQKGIIEIYDYSYIHIVGLTIANNTQIDAQGIIIEGNCQGIEIKDNEIYNINYSLDPTLLPDTHLNAQPLIVYGKDELNAITDLVIENNVIRDSRTGYSEGLAVNGNVDGFIVSQNRVYNISNIGIDIIGHEETADANDQARNGTINNNTVYNCKSPYATAAGIYVDGGKDLVIEFNRVFDCQWGIEVGCENIGKTTSNVIVRSNIIYDNDDAGISIGGYNYPSESGSVVDCHILNNTTYNNDKLQSGIGGQSSEITITHTQDCVIENNIFYGSNVSNQLLYVADVSSVNLLLRYNLYYSDVATNFIYEGVSFSNITSYKIATSQDANSIFQNPQFRNKDDEDFHLSANSPCINGGNPMSNMKNGSLDYDAQMRTISNDIDLGADEYIACATSLQLSGDLFSNSYSAVQEIQSTANVTQGSIVNLLASEIILKENSKIFNNGILSIINTPCN